MNLHDLEMIGRELRHAVRLFAEDYAKRADVTDKEVMQIARMYPQYDEHLKSGEKIKSGSLIWDGYDENDDPQLYRVMYDIAPSKDKRPKDIITAYTPVGVGESGRMIWVKPLWYLDAYQKGDVVEHGGAVYTNYKPDNMSEPGTEDKNEVLRWYVEGEEPPVAEVPGVPADEDLPVVEEPPMADKPVDEKPVDDVKPLDPDDKNSNGTIRWDAWKQPKVMTDYYNFGDGVTDDEGRRRISLIDFNDETPDKESWGDAQ
jgi:hypothetical protein